MCRRYLHDGGSYNSAKMLVMIALMEDIIAMAMAVMIAIMPAMMALMIAI